MDFDPKAYLQSLGNLPDADIDVAPAALALSALSRPDLNIKRYFHHLEKLCIDAEHFFEAGGSDAPLSALDKIAALKSILHDKHGYIGNKDDYDNLDNADLARVIDTRKGLPVALCILSVHVASSQGWDVRGIQFPGHVFCRLDHEGERVLFDPFYGFKLLEASDLREQLKNVLGPHAELSSDYFQAATNRELVFRLQNNIKLRQVDAEEYGDALETVMRMRMIDPKEYRLALDEGVLCVRTGATDRAINALEYYIETAPQAADTLDAAMLLDELRRN